MWSKDLDARHLQYVVYFLGIVVLYFVKRHFMNERDGKPSENEKFTPEQLFWKLIEKSRNMAKGDYAIQSEKLEKLLEGETPEFIVEFNNVFRTMLGKSYTWKLWAAAYIINGGCSDDTFYDFRSWLIGQGEMVYETVVNDPDSLANIDIETNDWEGLQYCAPTAYKNITENDLPKSDDLRLKTEPSGERWNEDKEEELKSLLPNLYAKYNP